MRIKWGVGLMKKETVLIGAAAALALAAIMWLKGSPEPYSGTYVAVNPPVDSGEAVVQSVEFQDGYLIMSSGDISQSVLYDITDSSLILKTDFGNFEYSFAELDSGIEIDGVQYIKQ